MTAPANDEADASRVALAAIAGSHGVKGEVKLKLFSDGIDSLVRHSQVYVGGTLTALRSVREGGKTAIARLAGCDSREAADALRGTLIEIDREALPPLEDGEYYHADLIGLTCFSEEGETIGSVINVENFGAGDLLEIEKVDGKKALIPFRDPMSRMEEARIVLNPVFLA